MSTVKKFIARIDSIKGVNSSLIVKSDGNLVASSVDRPADYASLIVLSSKFAHNIMDTSAFSFFQSMNFTNGSGEIFHIFPLLEYYLGVIQEPGVPANNTIQHVSRLLSLVKTPTAPQ